MYFIFSIFVSTADFSSSTHPFYVRIQGFFLWGLVPVLTGLFRSCQWPQSPQLSLTWRLSCLPDPRIQLPTGNFQRCLTCIIKISNSEVCAFRLRWDPPPSQQFDEKHPLSLLKKTREISPLSPPTCAKQPRSDRFLYLEIEYISS